jgi:hypothetical protein
VLATVVSVPVVESVEIIWKPFSDRTGPENVELPMIISCLGLSQALYAPVRDNQIIHNN